MYGWMDRGTNVRTNGLIRSSCRAVALAEDRSRGLAADGEAGFGLQDSSDVEKTCWTPGIQPRGYCISPAGTPLPLMSMASHGSGATRRQPRWLPFPVAVFVTTHARSRCSTHARTSPSFQRRFPLSTRTGFGNPAASSLRSLWIVVRDIPPVRSCTRWRSMRLHAGRSPTGARGRLETRFLMGNFILSPWLAGWDVHRGG